MDGKLLARLGAIIFVAVAITATAIEMSREEDVPAAPAARQLQPTTPDPLAVWAESRDRFLGMRSPVTPPAPHQNEGQ